MRRREDCDFDCEEELSAGEGQEHAQDGRKRETSEQGVIAIMLGIKHL